MKLLNSLAMGAAVAALMLASAANAAFAARAYIGTYTPDPADPHANAAGHGEGIYLVDVDPATGAPSNPRVVAKTVSPSWIVLSADRKFLYAVNEINTFGPSKSGSVTAFAVDQASGALKQLNVLDSGGSIPCFISIDPSEKPELAARKNPRFSAQVGRADAPEPLVGLHDERKQQRRHGGLDHHIGEHEDLHHRVDKLRARGNVGHDRRLGAVSIADAEQHEVRRGLHDRQAQHGPDQVRARNDAVEADQEQPGGDHIRQEAHAPSPPPLRSTNSA